MNLQTLIQRIYSIPDDQVVKMPDDPVPWTVMLIYNLEKETISTIIQFVVSQFLNLFWYL